MKLVDYFVQTPEENLAMDEALLINAEKGEIGETIRFWESKEYFVVVGRSGKVHEECHAEKCNKEDIKILRRISGGGTVLQGPGCLNYSIILSYSSDPLFKDINSSYNKILTEIVQVIQKNGIEAEVLPISDLALGGKKFSGNAQARKKKFFLHHGTILYDFDIKKINEYIKHPPREPNYRQKRAHSDFVTNLSLAKQEITDAVLNVFSGETEKWQSDGGVLNEVKLLSQEKYNSDQWNLMF